MNYQSSTFGLQNAYEIAKILVACGIVSECDLISITEQLMDGNFQPRKFSEEKSETCKKTCKKSEKVN